MRYRGLDKRPIVKRESGAIPTSGIGKLVQKNIALIGDAASMPNPTSLGGLSPIICASQILARTMNNLEDYEIEIKNHPMANPILLKPRHALMSFSNRDLANVGKFLATVKLGATPYPAVTQNSQIPVLSPKIQQVDNNIPGREDHCRLRMVK